MFQIMNMWDNIAFNIVSGIYSTVARVYDILLQLVNNNGSLGDFAFADIAATMYVLAGVFMLFRVTIGMIQMVINPDQMNDKQAGAGKLITRIVTSIILLLAFVPNGLLFGSDGLFKRVERALLANDGLIEQFMNMDGEYRNIKIEEIENLNSDFLVENVSAAEPALTCYYVNKKSQTWTNPNSVGPHTFRRYESKIEDIYKIEFYNGSGGTTGNINCANGKCKYSYTVRSDQLIGGKSENGYYASFPGKITMGNVFDGGFPSSCPKSFEKVNGHYAARKKFAAGNTFSGCGTNTVQTDGKIKCNNVGIMGGYSSLSSMTKQLKKLKPSTNGESHTVESSNPYISKNTGQDALNKTNTEYLNNLENPDEAIGFAQTSAKSFQECKVDKVEECDAAQGEMFKTVQGNNDVKDLLDKEDMRLDFITSVIAGIGLIIYLLILCVDVIVRKFKLLLLEMIAPIPIISYVDPKDKVFNQWLKMYFSVYVDLFIKLIAIGLAINLLEMLEDTFPSNEGLLVKFFYIVAILVFAKLVPSMISKIFGLDSMGGSFKDIMGMAKGAAGFGAGAVIGGAVGAATGTGLGRISGFGKGMMMGAGAGSKGKIMGGANAISAQNARINDAKKNGLNFWQRSAAGMAGTVGYSPKNVMDNRIKDKVDQKTLFDDFRKHKDNIESAADSSAYLKDKMAKYKNGEISWQDYKNARSNFIAANDALRQGTVKRVKDANGDDKFIYKDKHGFEHSSYDMGYYDENGVFQAMSGAKYEGSAYGKIEDAEKNLQVELETSGSLRRNLLGVTDEDGKTILDESQLNISTFADYEKLEKVALEGSKQANKEIIKVQKSDAYGRAKAFDDYSKKK